MSSEGCAAQCPSSQVHYYSPLQKVMDVWRTFFVVLTCRVGSESPLQTIMAVWCASNLKKSAPDGLYYLQLATSPDQNTQQNSLQRVGLGLPLGNNGTSRPDFQASPRLFKKKTMSPKETGRRLLGNPGIVI